VFGASGDRSHRPPIAYAAELKVPDTAAVERFDFEPPGLAGWKTVDGQWTVEEMGGAASGQRVLIHRAVKNAFNVIVPPGGPYTDVDVSVRFKPISGRKDASGGIVFRFAEGRYYVVRANALENNFRLCYYDRSRHQLATATIQPPALGQWHPLRVVAGAITSKPISTASACWTIATPALVPARSDSGPRPTRSPPLMTWWYAV
jgi:hypothetical protein